MPNNKGFAVAQSDVASCSKYKCGDFELQVKGDQITCRVFVSCRAQLPDFAGTRLYDSRQSYQKARCIHHSKGAMQNASASCND